MHTIDCKSNLSFYSIRREDKLLANRICSNPPIATAHSFLLSILFFCKAQTIVTTKFMQLMCFYKGKMCFSAVCVCVHMWTSFDWNITTRNDFFLFTRVETYFPHGKKCTIFLFVRFAQMPFWTINSIFIICQGTAKFKIRSIYTFPEALRNWNENVKTTHDQMIFGQWLNNLLM